MTEYSREAEALARVLWPDHLSFGGLADSVMARAQRAIYAGWVQRDDLVAHEDIARALCNEVWPLTRDAELFGPETPSARLLAAVRRIPDDVARQVAEALRGES